jgi:hypothetical protein
MISSLTEHTRKCLKFEYLGRIEYDFKKSRVTGSWDHKDSVSAKKVFKKIHACVPLTLRHLPPLRFHCIEECPSVRFFILILMIFMS